jgi:hypothetical protein
VLLVLVVGLFARITQMMIDAVAMQKCKARKRSNTRNAKVPPDFVRASTWIGGDDVTFSSYWYCFV